MLILNHLKGSFAVKDVEWLSLYLKKKELTLENFLSSYDCQDGEEIFKEAIEADAVYGVICPLCGGFMKYVPDNEDYHEWECSSCTGILLETG